MANYDDIDLTFTWDGDFAIDQYGDLASNELDHIASLKVEMHTVIKSEFDDWEFAPLLGANLTDFLGEPNTRETAELIVERINTAFSRSGIIQPSDLSVRIVPVHAHKILIILQVAATATPNNSLEQGDLVQVAFTYDTLEKSIFFLAPNEIEKRFTRS